MFLKNKNIIFKIRRSKVTDYAALTLGGIAILLTHRLNKVGLYIAYTTYHDCFLYYIVFWDICKKNIFRKYILKKIGSERMVHLIL